MTRDDEFIGQLEGYLEEYEGMTPLPGNVRDTVRAQLSTTKQINGFPMPRRFLTMNRPLQIALAAVAAVAVSVGALSALGPRFGIGSEPTPTEKPPSHLGIFEPVAGRIVYGDASGIWGIDPAAPADPATTVQLTSAAGIPLGWSGDGTRLLIMRGGQVFVLHADGSETQLTERPMSIRGATISPDGSRVVFAGGTGEFPGEPGSCCSGGFALYAVDPDGGPAEMLVDQDGMMEGLTFSPDGTRIAYVHGSGDHGHTVSVMDADGSNVHQILTNDVPLGAGHVRGLAWSPTGDRIALGLEGIIYTFATDGSDFIQIAGGDGTCTSLESCAVNLPRMATSPYWSPDGSQIAYTTGCTNGAGAAEGCILAIADADGSNVRKFEFGTSGPWHPAPGVDHPTPSVDLVTPTDIAVRIVYVASTDGEGMFYLLPDGSETQVTTDPIDIRGVTISPDGSRVVFAGGVGAFPGEPRSCCARGFALYAVDARGGPAELLVESRNGFVEQPTFAPDGTQIAYVDGVGDHGHSVWLVDADGSDAHQIVSNEWTAAAGHVDGLVWSPAGDRIVLTLEGITYSFATDGFGFTRGTPSESAAEEER